MSRVRHFITAHQGTLKLLVFTGCLIILAISVTNGFNLTSQLGWWIHPQQRSQKHACEVNLESDYIGLEQYTADYGGEFPQTGAAVKPGTGWAFGLQSYTKDFTRLLCPGDDYGGLTANFDDPAKRGYTDFWMNKCLGSKSSNGLSDPQTLLLLGDGDDGTDRTDSNYTLAAFPPSWMWDTNMPPFRHFLGANYLFEDGHIQWLKPDQLTGEGAPRFKP